MHLKHSPKLIIAHFQKSLAEDIKNTKNTFKRNVYQKKKYYSSKEDLWQVIKTAEVMLNSNH